MTDGAPRMTRLGKIRLGIKTSNASGTQYPKAVDYFVCPPEIVSVYGEKPRELNIMFPSDEVAAIAPVAMKMYSSTRGKVCTSDGETAVRAVDEDVLAGNPSPTQDQLDRALVKADSKNWSRRVIPCPNEECRFFQDNACKTVMNIQFMVLGVPGVGVYQLDTSSMNSIKDIRGGIELVKRVAGGHVAGIPLKLRVRPTEVHPDGKKKIVQTLVVVAMEKIEDIAALGEKSLHDILLPITEGKQPPTPAEPEDDLYPRSQIIDVAPARSAVLSSTRESTAVRAGPADPGDRGDARGSRASTDARSPFDSAETSQPARTETEKQLESATRVEQLFDELGTPPKERGIFRRAYAGRDSELVKFLEANLAKKMAKS